MWKKILLIILILGCDPMATKYNDYSVTDPNPENVLDAIDIDNKGKMEVSLSNLGNKLKPDIEFGSCVEISGARFLVDSSSDESISNIDPHTGSVVADGTVYVCAIPSVSADSCSFSFTATQPTWNKEKQGWYGSGVLSSARYINYIIRKTGTEYTKQMVDNQKGDRFFNLISGTGDGAGGYVFLDLTMDYDFLTEKSSSTEITFKKSGFYSIEASFYGSTGTSGGTLKHFDSFIYLNGNNLSVNVISQRNVRLYVTAPIELQTTHVVKRFFDAGDFIKFNCGLYNGSIVSGSYYLEFYITPVK